jgi:hypothetical protein
VPWSPLEPLLWTQALLPVQTSPRCTAAMMWVPTLLLLRSLHFEFRLRFPIYPSSDLFSLGDIGIPLPPPLLPISKGLTRFLPMPPHLLSLQTKTLSSFLPISSPFLASKTQNATVSRCGYFQSLREFSSLAFCPTSLTLTDRRLSYYSK